MIEIVETRDLATCQEIRRIVFIEEQGVPVEEELDGRDETALHFVAMLESKPVGTARLLMSDNGGKIGRVAVLKEARGTGLGKALILAAVEKCRGMGFVTVTLGAQTSAIGFYEALGFETVGPEFMDAGIPHRKMVCDL